jgi:hypothetical protein
MDAPVSMLTALIVPYSVIFPPMGKVASVAYLTSTLDWSVDMARPVFETMAGVNVAWVSERDLVKQ